MNATGRCPQCGTERQGEGPSLGLCPACMMKLGQSGAVPVMEEPIADERVERHAVQAVARQPSDTPARRARWWRERFVWLPALTILVLSAAGLLRGCVRVQPAEPESRLAIVTPPTLDPVSLAISPDGRKVVFAAVVDGRAQLWLRPMDAVSSRPLAGTEGASYPFWSPDSRNVGFFADGSLKRIGVEGESAQTLTTAPLGSGGTWNAQGEIVFADGDAALGRVPAAGGQTTPLSRLDGPRETGHRFPQFLPDGRHLLFYVAGDPEARGIYVLSTDSGERRRLLDADAAAVYEHSGHLLFVRQGTLFALAFDPRRLEIAGDPFQVADRVAVNEQAHVAAVSTSAAGPIVYRTGPVREQRQLVWVDRNGRINPLGEADSIGGQALSPDGRRIAFHKSVNGNTDIWLLDTARDVASRFTFDPAPDVRPIWSPDGNTVLFHSTRKGSSGIYRKPANGAGADQSLLDARGAVATDWSPEGRFVIYQSRSADSKTGWDIWALAIEGDRKPVPVVQTTFDELGAQFSPDGSWIAYQSNESGRFEIYVRSFPGPEALSQVTNGGGVQARWRRDGRELFFVAPDGKLVAVPMRLMRGQAIEPGLPVPMFNAGLGAAPSSSEQQYAVSPDGQRFLLNIATGDATEPLTVVMNWKAAR